MHPNFWIFLKFGYKNKLTSLQKREEWENNIDVLVTMNDEKTDFTVKKLADVFQKISEGIEKIQQDEFNKEIVKIYPQKNSKVSISADYDDAENSVGLSIYVSAPDSGINPSETLLSRFIHECLLLSDADKQKNV